MLRCRMCACALALLPQVCAAADLPAPLVVELPPPLAAPAPLAFEWSGFYFGGHGGWGFGQAPFVDGAVAGGQVGVNWQYAGFLIGAEGDGSWVDWEGTSAVGTARLRGGLVFDRFVVYGTGGAAFQDFDDVGWVVGGGLEYGIARNWTVGAEYLYYEFDNNGAADVFRARASYRLVNFAGSPGPSAMTAPASAFNWTGFYFGGHGGYSFVSGAGLTDGFEVGGQVGVNQQYGAFVLGIEIDGGYVDWGAVTTAGSVRLRGGYGFDRLLAYATGGMGIEDSIGWTVGAGVEYALSDRWSVGAEYLHHEFFGGHSAELVRGRVNYMFSTVGDI